MNARRSRHSPSPDHRSPIRNRPRNSGVNAFRRAWPAALIAVTFGGLVTAAHAQTSRSGADGSVVRWRIDPKTSLSWWQIDPHLGHLWATTCPEDPSWHAGQARSGAGFAGRQTERLDVDLTHKSSERIPLYPRDGRVLPVCREAVVGTIIAADTVNWRGVRGSVVLDPAQLFTGLKMRDKYARRAVYESRKYPEIRFTIDSLVAVRPGDTLRAIAVGTFEFRKVEDWIAAPLEAWRDNGRLRVRAQFGYDKRALTELFGISNFVLGMGVGKAVWKTIHLGVDLVLEPEPLDAGLQADSGGQETGANRPGGASGAPGDGHAQRPSPE